MVCLHNDSEWGMARLSKKKSLTATYAKQILMRAQNSAHTYAGSRLTLSQYMEVRESESLWQARGFWCESCEPKGN